MTQQFSEVDVPRMQERRGKYPVAAILADVIRLGGQRAVRVPVVEGEVSETLRSQLFYAATRCHVKIHTRISHTPDEAVIVWLNVDGGGEGA